MEDNNDKNIMSLIGLAIFFVFVIVLVIVGRTNKPEGKTALEEFTEKNSKTNNTIEEKMENAKNSSKEKTVFDDLKDNSYEFIYTIEDNGNKTIYSGKKTSNKMVIDIINNGSNRYYQIGENYLDKDLQSVDSIPLEYGKFINFDKLNKLYSYSITGTNGKRDVSVYDIYDIYYLDFMYDPFDIEGIEDSTMEITMADGYVSKVVLDFSTALTYMNQKDYHFVITMEFSNIGRVEDINIG